MCIGQVCGVRCIGAELERLNDMCSHRGCCSGLAMSRGLVRNIEQAVLLATSRSNTHLKAQCVASQATDDFGTSELLGAAILSDMHKLTSTEVVSLPQRPDDWQGMVEQECIYVSMCDSACLCTQLVETGGNQMQSDCRDDVAAIQLVWHNMWPECQKPP